MTNPATVKIDAEKANKWLGNGAQPTDTVRSLLKKAEIIK
jgi:small subunit ribosomal protein S16